MHSKPSEHSKLSVPVSELRRHTTEGIKAYLKAGPLVLTQRGKAVAVLLDPAMWHQLQQNHGTA
jgi:prevent-host-death family protein